MESSMGCVDTAAFVSKGAHETGGIEEGSHCDSSSYLATHCKKGGNCSWHWDSFESRV